MCWCRFRAHCRIWKRTLRKRINRLQKEWNDGLIKLDQYREQLGYEQDDDYGEMYKWETGAGASPEETLEKVSKLLGEKTDGIS